jgi:hypothetical protein
MAHETCSEAEPIGVVEATREEGQAILDRAARDKLGISAGEFLLRWDRHAYDDTDDPAVSEVAMLIPFAR